ncbi:MAG: EscU/YscU/HrcU family type III secretion system export apparatus switch protein [Planctomycetes bacterium]|nr:EscU/YscU/HrcU family type III secretion system export apparatus switch protein [Planctomycetota bacterium]
MTSFSDDDAAQGREPRAAALRYERSAAHAPRILAHGRGATAEQILALAREHDVPVREDRDLVELLCACDIGDEIPVELYGAVAELLSWLYAHNAALGPR